MAGSDPERLGSLARLVIALGVLLIVAGIAVHGITVGTLARIWHDLVERPDGPMAFRCVLQPAMAVIAAVHDGLKDARGGNRPFVETVLRDPAKRAARIREGLNATARILLLGLVMDGIYQALVLHRFYERGGDRCPAPRPAAVRDPARPRHPRGAPPARGSVGTA